MPGFYYVAEEDLQTGLKGQSSRDQGDCTRGGKGVVVADPRLRPPGIWTGDQHPFAPSAQLRPLEPELAIPSS